MEINPCSVVRKHNFKMAVFLNWIYRANKSLIKISPAISWRNWQIEPKIHVEMKEIQNIWKNLEKEQSWRTLLDFIFYYKIKVIKTVWYWHRSIELNWKSRNKHCIYDKLIFLTRVQKQFNVEKNSLFQQMVQEQVVGKNSLLLNKWCISIYKRMKLDLFLMPYRKIN